MIWFEICLEAKTAALQKRLQSLFMLLAGLGGTSAVKPPTLNWKLFFHLFVKGE